MKKILWVQDTEIYPLTFIISKKKKIQLIKIQIIYFT